MHIMKKNEFFAVILFSFAFIISRAQSGDNIVQTGAVKAEIRKTDSNYQLFRNGQPYFIKGAGGSNYPHRIAAYGGNSIRTWGTRGAQRVLDSAIKYGLTVLLGLDVAVNVMVLIMMILWP